MQCTSLPLVEPLEPLEQLLVTRQAALSLAMDESLAVFLPGPRDEPSDEEFGEEFLLPQPLQASAALVVSRKGKNKLQPVGPAAPGDQPAAPEGLPCLHEVAAARAVYDDPTNREYPELPEVPEPPATQVAPAAPPATGIGGCRAAYTHRIVM